MPKYAIYEEYPKLKQLLNSKNELDELLGILLLHEIIHQDVKYRLNEMYHYPFLQYYCYDKKRKKEPLPFSEFLPTEESRRIDLLDEIIENNTALKLMAACKDAELITNVEYKNFEKLNTLRNKIAHFALKNMCHYRYEQEKTACARHCALGIFKKTIIEQKRKKQENKKIIKNNVRLANRLSKHCLFLEDKLKASRRAEFLARRADLKGLGV